METKNQNNPEQQTKKVTNTKNIILSALLGFSMGAATVMAILSGLYKKDGVISVNIGPSANFAIQMSLLTFNFVLILVLDGVRSKKTKE